MDDYINEGNLENFSKENKEKIKNVGDGLNAGAAILGGIGAIVIGVLGLIKIFDGDSKDE